MLYYLWLVIDGLLVTSFCVVEWVETSGHIDSGLVKTRYYVKRNRSSLLKLFCKNCFGNFPYFDRDGINLVTKPVQHLVKLKFLFNLQFYWLFLLFGKKEFYPQELPISHTCIMSDKTLLDSIAIFMLFYSLHLWPDGLDVWCLQSQVWLLENCQFFGLNQFVQKENQSFVIDSSQ